MIEVVIGVDVGGTSSRVLVAGADGQPLVRRRGPGASFRSSAPGDALGTLVRGAAADLRAALDGAPWRVVGVVAGLTGAGPAGRTRARALLDDAVAAAHLPGDPVPELRSDPEIAFAAAAPSGEGSLLLAGTGAVACRMADFAPIARSDGLGWLLGDVGSGVWLGLAGLRAAAAALDGRGPVTRLVAAAAAHTSDHGADGTGDPRQDIVRLVDMSTPAELGRFAPAVTAAAAAGDEVAGRIAAEAAAALLTTFGAVDRGGTVVLAGSVLLSPGPVRDTVRTALARRDVREAAEPVVGAVALAARRAGWPPLGPGELAGRAR
ncbi:N-acetylglucosamine kinase-like BadF-type ATPase [Georgenia muralis]|uniref:N-acetylglucosamine kinase-like BadF-type ATPase n=2 Tax=Georgenia muralis TaxID=154117 RepID=A0A3N4Z7A6_9MICO|nr:N-acetylglucosamine kinase-like BadF-type ATPase [Georgenia muralis]